VGRLEERRRQRRKLAGERRVRLDDHGDKGRPPLAIPGRVARPVDETEGAQGRLVALRAINAFTLGGGVVVDEDAVATKGHERMGHRGDRGLDVGDERQGGREQVVEGHGGPGEATPAGRGQRRAARPAVIVGSAFESAVISAAGTVKRK
jgi:hypothetical protein